MQAVILEKENKLSFTEVKTPECGQGEALVKIKACGICRTDMKCYKTGQRDLILPRILGHEITGVVAETGSGVEKVKPGDRVQIHPGISCGKCAYCHGGYDNLCNKLSIMGFNYDGGFADYVLVPAEAMANGTLQIIPTGLSFTEASFVEPLACCINMQEALEIGTGENVLILGGGRFGILNAKLARYRGAEKVILVEPDTKRARLAKHFPFDFCINPEQNNILQRLKDAAGKRGIDTAILCCPEDRAMEIGLQSTSKKGKFGYFSGLVTGNVNLSVLNLIHYKELQVTGSYGCSLQHSREALKIMASSEINVNNLITRTLGLSEVETGISLAASREELSIVVSPADPGITPPIGK